MDTALPELEAANQRLTEGADRERAAASTGINLRGSSSSSVHSFELAAARAEATALRVQVEEQTDLIDQLRDELAAAAATDGSVEDPWRSRPDLPRRQALNAADAAETIAEATAATNSAQAEAEELRQKLAEKERELQRMQRRAEAVAMEAEAEVKAPGRRLRHDDGDDDDDDRGGGPSDERKSGYALEAMRLDEENQKLREENEKLSNELQAFDLDFFEEIEDLKYKYSEAARKLRQYEGRDG